jgi:3D (Asp-Asp-Asp) domain-containing protein
MWNTFYYLASEDDHEGPADTPIYDASCVEIGRVREGFHDSVCIEGSGRTSDGRVINAASACTTSCPSARTCGGRSYRVCYAELDPARFPWGQGARSNPLEPDRSIAVDPDFVALGHWIYFAELDGLVPPGASTPHDGCMRTDDVGGGIDGNQFDFFAGTRARWLAWEESLPTGSTLTAVLDDPRCFPRR